jgi:hypothetical protein
MKLAHRNQANAPGFYSQGQLEVLQGSQLYCLSAHCITSGVIFLWLEE